MRLVLISLAWCGGIVYAASLNLPTHIWLIASLAALTAAGLVFRLGGSRWLASLLVVFILGGLRLSLQPVTSDLASQNGSSLTLTGIVISSPELRDDGSQRFRVQAESTYNGFEERRVNGIALVSTLSQQNLRYGDRVRVTGELTAPARIDDFNYADYLAREQVFSLMQNASLTILSSGNGSPLAAALFDLRERFSNFIQTTLPDPAAGLLRGILLGVDGALAPSAADAFATTGSAHIIAISGFNMAVVAQTVLRLLRRFGGGGRTAAGGAFAAILVYTLFVGAEPAVVRAFIMTSVLIFGQLLRRRTYIPASIAFAALLLTIENPTNLFDIGFQLSVAATLGLALFTQPIARWTTRILEAVLPRTLAGRAGDFLTEPLAASLAAQAAVTPLIALYFGRLSLVSPIVNLLIVPVQPFIILTGGLALLLSVVIVDLAAALLWVTYAALSWSLAVIRLFAQLPFADISFRLDDSIVLALFAALMGGHLLLSTRPPFIMRWLSRLTSRPVIMTASLGALSLIVLTGMLFFSKPDGRLHVWALDMNGSNSILIQTPDGAHILVDGGASPQRLLTALGDILPFNKRTLDAVILTAPVEANFRALLTVGEFYQAERWFTNGQSNLGENFAALNQLLGSPEILPGGSALAWADGTHIEILHPQTIPHPGDNISESSLVLRIRFGEISFLLTGELTPDGQAALLESGTPLHATVLQLPRHAMARSLHRDFAEMVSPSVYFAQTQLSGRRGDADPDVLARLLPQRPVYLTHRQGTLHFWTDGQALWFIPERVTEAQPVR